MRLGILFDIDSLDGGFYGYKAYKALFQALTLADLAGCTLLDGDTNATLRGQRRDYCIAVDAPLGAQLERVRQALLRSPSPGLRPAGSRFLDDAAVSREPLVLAARVTYTGDLMQYTGWVREAWKAAGEERKATVPAVAVRSGGATPTSEEIITKPGGPTMTVKANEPVVSLDDVVRSSAAADLNQEQPQDNVQARGHASQFMPCPQCGASGVADIARVGLTWWGGLIGPRLLNHVQCRRCGATYNGGTGQSNNGAIAAYLLVILVLGVVLYSLASAASY